MNQTRWAILYLRKPSLSLTSLENWSIKDPYRTQIPKDGDHWEACFKKVQKLDDEMCQGWRDEIDTMLIFVRSKAILQVKHGL